MTAIRSWSGVRDSVHPLSRTAHCSVAHGRYIYVLNGYSSTNEGLVLFNQMGLSRYDILANTVYFVPVHWDYKLLMEHRFTESLLATSGSATALCPESGHQPARIFTFGGFSLLTNVHINALTCFTLPSLKSPSTSENSSAGHNLFVQLKPNCSVASVLSGHGLLSSLLSPPADSLILQAIISTTLRSLIHQVSNSPKRQFKLNDTNKSTHLLPSPRDKLCMEYWRGRLYAFGGYGPNFRPPAIWPSRFIQWPFLYDPNDLSQWIVCDTNGGWNNQLLMYDIDEGCWSLVSKQELKGQPPTPRAAHRSALLPKRGWMLIFGGRGPLQSLHNGMSGLQHLNDYHMGRLNDLHCLNLDLLEWTRVVTPLDWPNPVTGHWPCGRSWMDVTLVHESDYGDPSSYICLLNPQTSQKTDPTLCTQLFILGGFSNANESLNDAYVVLLSRCHIHEHLEAAIWEPNIPIRPLIRFPKPCVLNGFRCSSTKMWKYFWTPHVKVTKNYTLESLRSSSTTYPEDANRRPPFYNDLSYHILMYQQTTFNPAFRKLHGVESIPSPSEPFYRMAYTHTELVHFIIRNYSLLVFPHTAGFVDSFPHDGQCTLLLRELEETYIAFNAALQPAVFVLSLFIRLFLKFMFSFEILQMLLEERDAWIRYTDQQIFNKLLSSDCGVKISDQELYLNFSDLFVMQRFMLSVAPQHVDIPIPYRNSFVNSDGRLSNYLHQIVGAAFESVAKSPFQLTTNDLRALPFPCTLPNLHYTTINVDGVEIISPAKRHWHTITHAFNDCLYAIGGTNPDSSDSSVECYRVLRPAKLWKQCLEQAICYILPTYLERIKFATRHSGYHPASPTGRTESSNDNGSVISSTSDSAPKQIEDIAEICDVSVCPEELLCCNQLHEELNAILTDPIKGVLLRWLI